VALPLRGGDVVPTEHDQVDMAHAGHHLHLMHEGGVPSRKSILESLDRDLDAITKHPLVHVPKATVANNAVPGGSPRGALYLVVGELDERGDVAAPGGGEEAVERHVEVGTDEHLFPLQIRLPHGAHAPLARHYRSNRWQMCECDEEISGGGDGMSFWVRRHRRGAVHRFITEAGRDEGEVVRGAMRSGNARSRGRRMGREVGEGGRGMGGHRRVGQREESRGYVVGGRRERRRQGEQVEEEGRDGSVRGGGEGSAYGIGGGHDGVR
jgi:hypothetical protein